METQTSVAIPQEDGGLLIYSATQAPDYIVRSVSAALNMTAGKVRVEVKSVGGAYGGKATRSAHAAVACAVAASLLGVPVRTQVHVSVGCTCSMPPETVAMRRIRWLLSWRH
jgi:xanthine dehydrogenase large subunit